MNSQFIVVLAWPHGRTLTMSATQIIFSLAPVLAFACYLLYPKGGRFERVLLNVATAITGASAFGLLLEFMGAEFGP